ncbi:MAG: substrate-binding domain-containing protein [Spirochaetes bacterium]|nr:substrate-binding domain-containing protein [Spirochaetota bacterium]
MKKVILLSLIMAVAFSSALFAGGRQQAGPERHAFVFKNTGNPFGDRMMDGFRQSIEAQGYEAILMAPALPTAEAQIQIIDQLIAQRVTSITVAANDFDALQPALIRARNQGITVVSTDSAVNPASRITHVNQADTWMIGQTLVEAVYDLTGGSGDFAILSATSTASNQNAWIAVMQEVLQQSRFQNLNLVSIVFGDDLPDRSTIEAQGLLTSFPNLRVIVAPTTVGIAAASRVVTDQGLIGQVIVTGLGLPSQMAAYIDNGAAPYMYLWNPIEMGYLAGYTAVALSRGNITGNAGETFTAGRLGQFSVTQAPDGGTEILMGAPYRFDVTNINEWMDVF